MWKNGNDQGIGKKKNENHSIRGDPRYQAMVERAGLTDAAFES